MYDLVKRSWIKLIVVGKQSFKGGGKSKIKYSYIAGLKGIIFSASGMSHCSDCEPLVLYFLFFSLLIFAMLE